MTIAVVKALCSRIPWCEPAVLEAVLELALEIAREGREGRRIGTLFTVGKADEVVSESDGVRVFHGGRIEAPLIPELAVGPPPHSPQRRRSGSCRSATSGSSTSPLSEAGREP